MQNTAHANAIDNNFDLKKRDRQLIATEAVDSTAMSVAELEAIRTSPEAISASRHGLETITGASCETGAQ